MGSGKVRAIEERERKREDANAEGKRIYCPACGQGHNTDESYRVHYKKFHAWPRWSEGEEMNCPFCATELDINAATHLLACSLAEINQRGSKEALAWECERAYAAGRVYANGSLSDPTG